MSYHHNQSQSQSQNTSTDSKNGQSSSSTQAPIDWSSFMSFQSSPNAITTGGNGYQTGMSGEKGGNQRQSSSNNQQDQDNYSAFAQGIAMSRPQHLQQPPQPPYRSNSSSTPRQTSHHLPSPHQSQMGMSDNQQQNQASGSHSGKGKSPMSNVQTQIDSTNGLSLDPSSFSRDIRFQVPSFLSNHVGGAPTVPPGGEAWSGFSPANLFDGSTQGTHLTPGALFGTAFGQTGGQDGYNDNGGGGRNVLEGLSGFMNDTNWENWGEMKDSPNNFGTTFYVNPNPSPNVLAPKPVQDQQRQLSGLNNDQHQSNQSQTLTNSDGTTHRPKLPQHISSSVSTSAIFNPSNDTTASFDVPSISTPTGQHSNKMNVASSSSQPYIPPNQSLLQGPSLPPNLVGTSLTDGPGLYSTTGFDMVGVLARVAGRKDPKTQLGPVDLSCSFVVVDIRRYDQPIVYASPTFAALTGYDTSQIIGRNCRFLQSPDGEVVKGSKRKYTDNVAVAHFKRMLNAGKECQASLINYRRGGMPFINLVTVIPIPWEGTEIVYHVGFQVDLVEQPNAILRNMRDGSYQVNYTVTNIPQPALRAPGKEMGVIGLSQEILDIMGSRIGQPGFAAGEDGGKSEWLKMVLENADDFVHVLSLKGLFQYVSPSVRRVLEYDPEDLMNKNISDICHPSDIVPLMRELKDSTHVPSDGTSARMVNLVFRVRRKSSGYVWIECTGRLHVEPGKGRKAVILSGRARSVPTLPWDSVNRQGGLADHEFWLKTSFEGLLLHSTSSIYSVLGKRAEQVIGHNILSLLPGGGESRPQYPDLNTQIGALASAIQQAAKGEVSATGITVRHMVDHASGNHVEVQTIIYPARGASEMTSGSGSESPISETSGQSNLSASTVSGIKPSTLVIQIKAIPLSTRHSIVHPLSANVFEELETTRGTSWQYELHQLRLLNRRLKEDIATLRVRSRNGSKNKKRKLTGDMGPPRTVAMPESYSAAPRHQLAPGFGLVAPGMPSPYYR